MMKLRHQARAALPTVIIAAVLLAGCAPRQAPDGRLNVFVSIVPLQYIVETIAGPAVTVRVLVPPGASPHTYEPRPSQMAELTKAKAFFAVGIEFENAWLPRIAQACPGIMVVHADSGIARIPTVTLAELQGAAVPPGLAGDNDEGVLDPHIWLSPQNVKQMTATIARALGVLDPAQAAHYRAGAAAFTDSISALQREIAATIDKSHTRTFMVFHPSWGYFAREFGLTQIPIEFQGKEPTAREMAFIVDVAKRQRIRTIFVQPQFSRTTAETIAGQIGASIGVADDLAYDWAENLRRAARAFGE